MMLNPMMSFIKFSLSTSPIVSDCFCVSKYLLILFSMESQI